MQTLQYIHDTGIFHSDIEVDRKLFNESLMSEGNNKSDHFYKGITYLEKNKNRKTTQYFQKFDCKNKRFKGTSRFATTFVHDRWIYFPRDDI